MENIENKTEEKSMSKMETTACVCAYIFLIAGIIASIVIFCTMGYTSKAYYGSHINIAGIGIGISTLISTLFLWSTAMLLVNISKRTRK